jgi:hypothetical protein
MSRYTILLQSILLLVFVGASTKWAAADHFDNQTAEERPKKKKPFTKYQKSEYFSKVSGDTGRPYLYTEDGDVINPPASGSKKHGKKHHRSKDSASPAPSTGDQPLPNQPRKVLQPMHLDNSEDSHKEHAGAKAPDLGAQAGGQAGEQGGPAATVHVAP